MPETKHDVVSIGNAIVDILGHCDDAFLEAQGAPKGHMRLIDSETASRLYDAMGPAIEVSGGSAANTSAGLASLGGASAFIGKVADDDFGRVFTHDIRAAGVTFRSSPAKGGEPTARSLILVTPDGERTMNTFLGISPELGDEELDPELISESQVVYLEGYLFDREQAKAAFRRAAQIARDAGRKVALSLSDGFCVDRHRSEFLELIKSSVDIVIANEVEITSLYQTTSFDEAAARTRQDAELAALTRSEKGSLILGNGTAIEIAPAPVDQVVDATGAGDLYAAGFLYGVARGLPLETAGRLGSLAAAEVLSHLGARPRASLRELAQAKGLL